MNKILNPKHAYNKPLFYLLSGSLKYGLAIEWAESLSEEWLEVRACSALPEQT